MPGPLTSVLFFLSAYSPVLAILGLVERDAHPTAAYLLFGVAIASAAGLYIYLAAAWKFPKSLDVMVRDCKPGNGDMAGYVAAYLLPFIGPDLGRPSVVIGLIGAFVMLGVSYMQSNMLFVNPILALGGFHLYEARSAADEWRALLTRKSFVRRDAQLTVIMLGSYIWLDVSP